MGGSVLSPAARARIREALGTEPAARAFAEAVVRQVAAPPGAARPDATREADALDAVLRLLAAAGAPDEADPLVRRLAADAPLLAACFGNVDLLYQPPFAGADAVGARILAAVARLDAGG